MPLRVFRGEEFTEGRRAVADTVGAECCEAFAHFVRSQRLHHFTMYARDTIGTGFRRREQAEPEVGIVTGDAGLDEKGKIKLSIKALQAPEQKEAV